MTRRVTQSDASAKRELDHDELVNETLSWIEEELMYGDDFDREIEVACPVIARDRIVGFADIMVRGSRRGPGRNYSNLSRFDDTYAFRQLTAGALCCFAVRPQIDSAWGLVQELTAACHGFECSEDGKANSASRYNVLGFPVVQRQDPKLDFLRRFWGGSILLRLRAGDFAWWCPYDEVPS